MASKPRRFAHILVAVAAVLAVAAGTTGIAAAYTDDVQTAPLPFDAGDVLNGPGGRVWVGYFENHRLGNISTNLMSQTTFNSTFFGAPNDLVTGPDGNVWLTDPTNDAIVRFNPNTQAVQPFTDANVDAPQGIAVGADGNLWFASRDTDRIGRITTAGVITTFTNANIADPAGIVGGPDGNLWFASTANNRIGRITTGGTVTTFPNAQVNFPEVITAGPDGALWFSNVNATVGRITTGGAFSFFSHPDLDDVGVITNGPDGNLWLTEPSDGSIWRVTPGGSFTEFRDCQTIINAASITTGPDNRLWFTAHAQGVGSVIARLTPAPYPSHCFPDVPDGAFYEDGLRYVKYRDIVTGFPDGTYHPKEAVNRGQAVNMLWRFAGAPGGNPAHGFNDIPAGAFYEEALRWAKAEGLVTGFPDGGFHPKDAVNRGQIANMFWQFAGAPGGSPPHGFTDIPAGAFYEEGLKWVKAVGVVSGFPDGTYHPKEAVNRGQIANMLYHLD